MTDQRGERHIGVALSGGGHRATVFGLGALLALVDQGLNREVVSVASLSARLRHGRHGRVWSPSSVPSSCSRSEADAPVMPSTLKHSAAGTPRCPPLPPPPVQQVFTT